MLDKWELKWDGFVYVIVDFYFLLISWAHNWLLEKHSRSDNHCCDKALLLKYYSDYSSDNTHFSIYDLKFEQERC